MTNQQPTQISLQVLKGSLWVLLTQRASEQQFAGCLLFRTHGQGYSYWRAKACTCEGAAFDWIQLLSLELIKCFCTGHKGPHTIIAFVFFFLSHRNYWRRSTDYWFYVTSNLVEKKQTVLWRENRMFNTESSLPSWAQDICYLLQAVDHNYW